MSARINRFETFYNLANEVTEPESVIVEEEVNAELISDEQINEDHGKDVNDNVAPVVSNDIAEMASKILANKQTVADNTLQDKQEEKVENVKAGIEVQNKFTERLGALSNFIFKPKTEKFVQNSNVEVEDSGLIYGLSNDFFIIWVLFGLIGITIAYYYCGPSHSLNYYSGLEYIVRAFRLFIKYIVVFLLGIIYTPYKLLYAAGMGHFRHYADFVKDSINL